MAQKNEDQWSDRFKDAVLNEEGSAFFETYGRDLEAVKAADERKVWSIVEGDEGQYLIPGFHVVNLIGYVLSQEPITDEEIASGEWDETIWDNRNEADADIRP
jgi:hypothetical protein